MPRSKAPPNISTSKMQKAIDAGLEATLDVGKALYLGTYHNWEETNKPEFKEVGPKTVGDARVLDYETGDTPYVWIDEGTDGPYTIKAKNKPALKFKTGGMPKTFKNSLISTAGRPGTDWNTKLEVTHPGIEERNFSENIGDKLDEIIANLIQIEIDKAVD